MEVALAATILLVGFAGMAEALIIGSEMLDTARKQTIAAQIMQSGIEYLRIQPWSTIQGLASTSTTDYPLGIPVSSSDTTTPFYYSLSSNLKTVASSFTYSLQLAGSDPHANTPPGDDYSHVEEHHREDALAQLQCLHRQIRTQCLLPEVIAANTHCGPRGSPWWSC